MRLNFLRLHLNLSAQLHTAVLLVCVMGALSLDAVPVHGADTSVSADTEPVTFANELTKAASLYRNGQLGDALIAAQNAGRLDPTRYEAPALGTVILQAAGRLDEARLSIAQAMKLAPPDRLTKLQDLERAINSPTAGTKVMSSPAATVSGDSAEPVNVERRRRFNVLMLVIEDADKAQDVATRQKFLGEFLDESAAFVAEFPDDSRIWLLRALACVELERASDGILAARAIDRLGLISSDDPKIVRLVANLDRRGWIGAKTTAEIDAQVKAEAQSLRTSLLAPLEEDRVKAAAVQVAPFEANDLVVQSIGLKMIAIKPGFFLQGDLVRAPGDNLSSNDKLFVQFFGTSPPKEPDNLTARYVVINQGYWLGETEVTEAQWKAVMKTTTRQLAQKGTKGSETVSDLRELMWQPGTPQHPMVYVGYEDALEFCSKLTEMERKAKRLPLGYEFRLPTEAQWEYACRAGTTDDFAGTWEEMGWFDENSGRATHAVRQKQPNPWGLYDMHGNVGEWCQDWYAEYEAGMTVDPAGPVSGSSRVHRGGSLSESSSSCRSASRHYGEPRDRLYNLGFRLALAPVSRSKVARGTPLTSKNQLPSVAPESVTFPSSR